MNTLEEALKLACAKGMTHLTLYPVASADGKKIYWVARATPSAAYSYQQAEALDPVEAVLNVLKALPSAKRRAPMKDTPLVSDAAYEEGLAMQGLTAPVTEPQTPPEPETFDTWLPKT